MKRSGPLVVLLVVATSHACSTDSDGPTGPETDVTVASVTVEPGVVALGDPGEARQLSIVARTASGRVVSDFVATWSSADTGVARVEPNGRVRAVAEGQTTVTATVGGVSGTASVAVAYRWSAVAPGSLHACALRGGKPYCWGAPLVGPIVAPGGDGVITTPTPIETDQMFVALDSGDRHTCALTADGALYCWGQNNLGQLGDGTDVESAVPVPVSGGMDFSEMSLGAYHTCGLTESGAAYCWGGGGNELNGRDLALGHEPQETCVASGYFSSRCSKVPRPVIGGFTFTHISAGLFHTCAVDAAGAGYCWGWNHGMLGNGESYTTMPEVAKGYRTPGAVVGGHVFDEISAGNLHTCGVTSSGSALCWGAFDFDQGQLGRGTFMSDALPGPVVELTGITSIEAAKENSIYAVNTCALVEGGAAYCWGADAEGQVGSDVSMQACAKANIPAPCTHTPTAVQGGLTFLAIESGLEFACGLTTERDLYCWGINTRGQLGSGTLTSATTPTRVRDPARP